MNGKTSANLGKQQTKSLSELNQYNMEPTITDNRIVVQGRSSIFARCAAVCFGVLAFLLIGNSQVMAQCGMSQSQPADTFFLDANCMYDATLISAFSAIGSTCDTSVISTDPNDLNGSIRSSIFDQDDLGNNPLTIYVRSTNGVDTSPSAVTLQLYIFDNTPPTIDITPSDTIIYCSDWGADLDDGDAVYLALLANGVVIDTFDNCGIQDVVVLVDTLSGFDGTCNDSIVGSIRIYITVSDIATPTNFAIDSIDVHFADTSLPTMDNTTQIVQASCDDDFSEINIDTSALDIIVLQCALVDAEDFDFILALVDTFDNQGTNPDSCDFYNYEITRRYVVQRACAPEYESTDTVNFVIEVRDTTAPVVDSALLEDAVDFTVTGDSTNVDSTTATITAQANNVNVDSACVACIEIDLAVEGFITDNCAGFDNLLILYSRVFADGDSLGFPEPDTLKQRGETEAVVDTCYAIGVSTIAFTIIDACNNSTEYVVTIEVLDLDAPVIEDCPEDIEVAALDGDCSRIIEWLPPSADDCSAFEENLWAVGPNGQELIILGPTGDGEWFAEFSVGVSTVYHEFVDEFGNADTCIFTVTVFDEQAPEVVYIDTITVELDASGNASITENDFIVSIDDNCQALAPTVISQTEFTCEDLGENDVDVVVADTSGNTTEFVVVVIVVDNMAPVLEEGEDVVATYTGDCGDPQGNCLQNVEVPTPEFSDNCEVVSVINDFNDTDDASGDYPVGVTMVTWTATDQSGNTTQFVQQVTVLDQEAPQIEQLPNIELFLSVENEDGCNANATWDDPIITDCSAVIVSQTHASGDLFGLGVSIVQYTVTDIYGNSCTMSFTVTVIDDVDPTISCPAAPFIIQSICSDVPLPDLTSLTTASDNCSGPLTYTQDPEAGTTLEDVFGEGNLEEGATADITITVTDASGNSSSCIVTIQLVDLDAPVPAEATLDDITPWTTPGASCSSLIVEAPIAYDCQGGVIYGSPSTSNGAVPGSNPPAYYFNSVTFSPGVQITWTYNNPNGLSAQQHQFIQVIDDEVEPLINVDFDGFVDGEITIFTGDDDINGFNCTVIPADAEHDWTVTANPDPHVLDLEMPENAGETVDNCGVVALWFTVEYDGEIVFTSDTSDVSVNPAEYEYELGTSIVTVYAADAAGNVGSSSFTVIVEDNEAPIFDTCPDGEEFSFVVDEDCNFTVTEEDNLFVEAFDNCPGIITYEIFISSSEEGALVNGEDSYFASIDSDEGVSLAGIVFNVAGTASSHAVYDVFIYAFDQYGNVGAPCGFTIEISDNIAPTMVCVSGDRFIDDQEDCGYVVQGTEFDPIDLWDNCTAVEDLVITNNWNGTNTLDGEFFALLDESGSTTYEVIWTIEDNAGNSSTCITTITVIDNIAPEWVGFEDQEYNLQANSTDCEALFFWTRPNVSNINECSEFEITESISDPIVANNVNALYDAYDENVGGQASALFPVGTTTITYTATDLTNNLSTIVTITVIVEDVTAPTIACSGPQMIPSICPLAQVPDYTGLGVVNDNCSNYSVAQVPAPGTALEDIGVDLVNGGQFEVTLTVTDHNNGLTASCSFMVTMLDNDAPVPNVQPLTAINLNTDLASGCMPYELPRPTATNCFGEEIVGITTVQSPNVLTETSIIFHVPGTYVLVWSYIDGINVSQQTQVVTVTADQIAPSVVCPLDITVDTDPGSCDAVVNLLLEEVALTATTLAEYNAQVAGLQPGQYIDNCGGVSYTYTITNNGDIIYENMSPEIIDTEEIVQVTPEVIQTPFSDAVNTIPPSSGNFNDDVHTITSPDFFGQVQVLVHANGTSSGGAWRNEYRVQVLAPNGQNITQGAPGGAGDEWQPSSLGSGGSFSATYNAGIFNSVEGNWTVRSRKTWPGGTQDVNIALEFIPLVEFAPATYDTIEVYGDFRELPVGDNTVTYTLTDGEGNTSTCSFTVTVQDNEAPVFADCPGGSGDAEYAVGQLPAQVRSTGGVCGTTPAQLANVCDCPTGYVAVGFSGTAGTAWGANVLSSFVLHCRQVLADGTFGPLTDVTCSNGTAVGPNIPPTQMAPAGHALVGSQNALGCALDRVVGRSKPISDVLANSPNTVNSTMPNFGGTGGSLQTLQLAPNGSVIVGMQTYIDPSNQNIVAGVAWRHANLQEIVLAAATIVVEADPGSCFYTAPVDVPAVTDNCEVASYTVEITNLDEGVVFSGNVSDLPSELQWPLGINNVVFVATDPSGNSSECSYSVLVIDTERPEIECPENIAVENDPGVCSAVVEYDPPVVSDNCPGELTVQLFQGLPSGSAFPVGTTTNIFIVTDASGNTQICSFDVTVTDTEAPQFVNYLCDQTIQVNNLTGDCFNNVEWTRPGFANLFDNCTAPQNLIITEEVVDNPSVVIIPSGFVPGGNAFASFPVGITTIRYTATDEFGNQAECFVHIEVIDTEDPVISCVSNFVYPTVCADAFVPSLIGLTTADDNCDDYVITQSPGVDQTIGDILGGDLGVGASFPVVLTVTDSYGNAASCTTMITLSNPGAPVPQTPVIAGPLDGGLIAPLTPQTTIAATCAPLYVPAPTALTDCGTVLIYGTLSAGGAGVTPIGNFPFEAYWFEAGNYTITWVFNDGNPGTPNSTQIQVIQVTNDTHLPVVACPEPGEGSSFVFSTDMDECTATGVAGIGLTAVSGFGSIDEFNDFVPAPGEYADNCGATVQYSLSGATTVALTDGNNAGVETFNVGVTTVTYVVTDAAGNSVSCSFDVEVVDNQAPALDCVESVTVFFDANGQASVSLSDVLNSTPTDNCGIASVEIFNNNFNCFDGEPIGFSYSNDFTETFLASGWSGVGFTRFASIASTPDNLLPCEGIAAARRNFFSVGTSTGTVTSPNLTGLTSGGDVNVSFAYKVVDWSTAAGNQPTTGNWGQLEAQYSTDNGSTWTTFYTINEGNHVPSAECATVSATIPGSEIGEQVRLRWSGLWFEGDYYIYIDDVRASQQPVFTNIVTVVATDVHGNSTSCEVTVIAIDDTAPTINCPEVDEDGILVTLGTSHDGLLGNCATSFTWNHPVASDNCVFDYTVTYTNPDGSTETTDAVSGGLVARVFDLGLTELTYTATDNSGNITTCSFYIEVVDDEAPIAICDPIVVALNEQGYAIITQSVIDNNINDGSYDNCGPITFSVNQDTFFCADLGVNPIQLIVTDAAGNVSICNTTVTVLDNNFVADPTFPDDITITNCQDYQDTELTGYVTGHTPCDVDNVSFTDNIIAGDCPGNFVVERTWQVFDAAGIPTVHVQIITVVDNQGPIMTGVPANITLTSCEGLSALIAGPGNAQAFDCPGDGTPLAISYNVAISTCTNNSYTVTRTWTATDACGNTTVATQVITVIDNVAPTITGPAAITVNVSDHDVTSCVSFVDVVVTVTDCNAAGPTVVTNNFNSGGANASGVYPVGTTQVVFTATDACGNVATHTVLVTVVDDVNPVAICLESFNVVLNNQGVGTIAPWQLDNGSYDNCEDITLYLNEVGITSLTFTCDDLGPQPVVLVVQDAAGNVNECTTIVNVMADAAGQLEVQVVTTDETAVGANDGTATAVVTGGSGTYVYFWSNGETTQTITGLSAGTYSVTVSDADPANCATAEGEGVVGGGAPLTFHVGSAAGAVGDIVEVPVSVENFANMAGFQFSIDVVDGAIGQIVGFSNFGLPGMTSDDFNPAAGTVSWINSLPAAVSLADGSVIFHIQIQIVGGLSGASTPVVITSSPLTLEAYQEQGGMAVEISADDIVTTDGEVVVTVGLSGPFAIGGNIITEDGLPVGLVHVALTGDETDAMTTTSNGMYFFDDIELGSNVTVTPSKDINHLNGVTTFDAVLLQRHLLGTEILNSPYKKIAADIDSDGMLTVGDLIQLRRVILLIDNDFISPFTGMKNNTSWRFALPGLTDPAPASMIVPAYEEVRNYTNLNNDYIADHFIAVKIGDLNNTNSPNALAPVTGDNARPANYRSTMVMLVEDADFRAGETVTVDFMAKDFVDVAGYQFTFSFDAQALEFAGVESADLRGLSADNFGLTFVEEGAITVSWNDVNADLANNDVLFSMTFVALNNESLRNAIEITSDLIRVEGYRNNGEFMDITIQFTNTVASRGEFILYQNEPNPFVSETRVGFELPEETTGTLYIFDATGRMLRSYPGKFTQGYNEIVIERADLPVSGVLYYQLSTPTHSATKKMIIAQ